MNTDVKGMNSELAREKMWSRIHLIPLLTAEEDRDLVRRHLADQAREKALLGSQTSPYNSDKYVRVLLLWRGWGFRDWNADANVWDIDTYDQHTRLPQAKYQSRKLHIFEAWFKQGTLYCT